MTNQSAHAAETPRRFVLAGALTVIVLGVLTAAVIAGKYMSDPHAAILLPEQGATWIRLAQPTDLFARPYQPVFHGFRRFIPIRQAPERAVLYFRAMRRVSLFIDKTLVFVSDPAERNWKKKYQVDIAPFLSPGTHEIFMKVLNPKGHPALLAYCPVLDMRTGPGWEAGADGRPWAPAMNVDPVSPSGLSRRFQRADRALLHNAPVFTAILVLTLLYAYLLKSAGSGRWGDRIRPTAGRIRFVMMGLWGLLAVNNIAKIPLDVGMDVHQHFEYVRYVAERLRIPLPTEGIQMFEAPFFYILCAGLYKTLVQLLPVEAATRGLRIISLLSGLFQIELCYRAARHIFPRRGDLQTVATLTGAFFPMNIYMSQVIGTEPLAGALSGGVVLLMFRLLRHPAAGQRGAFIVLGFCWGLALLTKVTAVLLFVPVVFFSVYALSLRNFSTPALIRRNSLVIGIALLVCGWYYLRNWLAVGHFFVGGWDPSRGILWWQDPGYRSLSQLFHFGESLRYPVYAGVTGFWDALYSTLWMDGQLSGIASYAKAPPWNYGYMLACAWLSLLPTAAVLLGIARAVRHPASAQGDGTLFAASCLVIYIAAIGFLFLTVPIYSIVKGSYTMGLIPCYAVLCASGFDVLTRRRWMKIPAGGIMACWAFSAYAAYVVI